MEQQLPVGWPEISRIDCDLWAFWMPSINLSLAPGSYFCLHLQFIVIVVWQACHFFGRQTNLLYYTGKWAWLKESCSWNPPWKFPFFYNLEKQKCNEQNTTKPLGKNADVLTLECMSIQRVSFVTKFLIIHRKDKSWAWLSQMISYYTLN